MRPSGLEPETYGLKVRRLLHENKGISTVVAPMVATETVESGCERLFAVDDLDADLSRLMKAWPTLPVTVRRMMLAVLDAAQNSDQ